MPDTRPSKRHLKHLRAVAQPMLGHHLKSAAELGQTINESVIKPTQEKVKEGKLFDEMATNITGLATKVQGAGAKGWNDVTSFFSGKPDAADDDGSAYQEGYQSKDSCSSQDGGGRKQDFWETFGSNSALSSASVQKNSSADGWESWDNDWDKSTKNPSKPAEETWDNSGW